MTFKNNKLINHFTPLSHSKEIFRNIFLLFFVIRLYIRGKCNVFNDFIQSNPSLQSKLLQWNLPNMTTFGTDKIGSLYEGGQWSYYHFFFKNIIPFRKSIKILQKLSFYLYGNFTKLVTLTGFIVYN